MSNLFYDKEEQDSLLIPVEDEQYTVVTGTNEDSVMTIDNSLQQDSILVPEATQSVILMETGTTTPKPSAPVGDYVTVNTEQTITGNKDFAGKLTFHGVTVATLDDIDLSNLVDLTSQQTISGVKVFENQIGIINNSDGDINLIKHINNNFLITENNGTNILNIDEQLQAMYLYNQKIATEEYVNDKAMEGGSGTVVSVGGVEVSTLNFISDPQTQIDNIGKNLPKNVSDLTNDAGFITKSVDNLANYYDKNYIDSNHYDKNEVDQRIPTALSHLTNDVGFIDSSVSDLANYYGKSQIDTLLLHKADKTTLNDYYKSTDVDNLLSNKVDTTTLTTNYYNKTQTDDLLDTKASTSSVTNAITESKGYTDTKISELIGGAPETLNTLKEIADAFAEDQEVLDALETAIGNKVDKVTGKGLSTNDYTDAEKTKLASLANYDDTAIYNEVNKKANKSELDNYYKKTETYDVVEIDGLLNAKYEKPSTGIPKTDLASDVQTSLVKADSALPKMVTAPVFRYRIYGVDYNTTEPILFDSLPYENGTNSGWLAMYDVSGNLHTKTPVADTHATTKSYVDTNLGSVKTELENAIDDIRDAIGSSGTVVQVGGENQALVEFDSDPQTQLDNKVSTTTTAYSMYGTDGSGKQTTYHMDMGDEITAWSVPIKGASGTLACGDATRDMHAVNLGQLESKLSQKANLMSIRPNYVAVGHASGNGYPTDSSVLITDLAKKDEIPDVSNLASKDEIPTNYVTTDTEQTITARKDFKAPIYFHFIDDNEPSMYEARLYQYGDTLDIARAKEDGGGSFANVASFNLASKTMSVGGNKVATIPNLNTLSMKPSNAFVQVKITGETTLHTNIFTAPTNGFAMIRGAYSNNAEYYIYDPTNGGTTFYQWAKLGSVGGVIHFPMRQGQIVRLYSLSGTISWADLYFIKAETI